MSVLWQNDGRNLAANDVALPSFAAILEKRRHERTPFLSYYSNGKKTHDLSFNEFMTAVDSWVARFETSGIAHAGKPLVVLTGNKIETFFIYAAALAMGAVVMPVDPGENLSYVEKVASFAGATGAIAFADWKEKLSGSKLSCVLAEPSQDSRIANSTTSFSSPSSVFFTSGTTGDAKGVLQSIGAALANAEGTRRAGNLTPNDVLTSCLPLYHVNAFNFSFLLPLYLGCRIVYMNAFTPVFWRILADEKATVGSVSPPVLRLLLKDNRAIEASPTIRYFISASSALHRPDLDGIKKRFGVRVCQAYGLSETINFTLFTPPDLSNDEFERVTKSGELPPAGAAVWGQKVAIADEAGLLIEADGTPGEVVVRGWNVMKGYINNADATAKAFAHDWFHTGDVAFSTTIDGQRYFTLCGRLKETVKRSGVQIYLSEIDQAAREIGLESACAVGFRNVHTDEEVGLFLVRSPDERRSAQEILDTLSAKLPFMKTPKALVEGPEIPKTAVGKIKRNDLKSAFESYAETRFQPR